MMDAGSWKLGGSFDLSKSPYFRSLFPSQKRAFPTSLKHLHPSLSHRHQIPTFPSLPQSLKPQPKAERRAAQLSATRLQLQEVTAIQLETEKQRKREESVKALIRKRREIAEMRAGNTERITNSRSEVLEGKRVFFR